MKSCYYPIYTFMHISCTCVCACTFYISTCHKFLVLYSPGQGQHARQPRSQCKLRTRVEVRVYVHVHVCVYQTFLPAITNVGCMYCTCTLHHLMYKRECLQSKCAHLYKYMLGLKHTLLMGLPQYTYCTCSN